LRAGVAEPIGSAGAEAALPAGAAARFVETNGLRLHVVEAGPLDGPLVLLLHGFPEFWYGWRRQIAPLVEAGYRVVVPDQRGYNLSDKPRPVSAYRLDLLAADVEGLIDAAGRERAHLVGHDWGAAVAWWLALRRPERVASLAVLNVPHPVVMRRHLLRNPRQRRRSWYIFFFQLPWLPEWYLRRRNWRNATRALRSARPGSFSDADLARYRQAWSRPGAMRAMVSWYRAAPRGAAQRVADVRVRVPTLILWGVHDVALGRELAPASRALCDAAELVFFEDATHWLQHDEAEAVSSRLCAFLAGGLPALRPE
jgi:pimeloyl-ACP methyl ester carboxylesterase